MGFYNRERCDRRERVCLNIEAREVNFFALRIDDDGRGAAKAGFARLFGKAINAADADESDVAAELPVETASAAPPSAFPPSIQGKR